MARCTEIAEKMGIPEALLFHGLVLAFKHPRLFISIYYRMFNPDAIELARRHEEAYNKYFGKIRYPPEESVLALMLHPLFATNGRGDIINLMGSDNGNDIVTRGCKTNLVKN